MSSSVRVLAQSDPVPNLATHLGGSVEVCRKHIEHLTNALRELDKLKEQLAEHKIVVEVDLGPIGNAAAAARRDLEKRSDSPTFSLPR
jgi:hypothetical protein